MAFTNWLARSNRAGGEWNTPNITVPSGIKKVTIQLNLLSNSDFATSDRSLTITIQTSADSGLTWREQCTVAWLGGPPSAKSGGWSASIDNVDRYIGQLVRAHISQSGTFRYGIRGEIA